MKNKTIIFLFSLVFIQCSTDRAILSISETENQTLLLFQQMESNNQLYIADQNEPGEQLFLCLTFVNKENQNPLSNQSVHFYHASVNGKYQPIDPSDESTARLNGTATTNAKGQIYIETILPGDYGNSQDNRHIHTTVKSAQPTAYDIHFKQYTTYMGKNFIKDSDQHFLANLKQTKDNKLVTFLTIEVKKPKKIE